MRRLTSEARQRLAREYAAIRNCEAVAAKYSVSPKTVTSAAREFGVPVDRRGFKTGAEFGRRLFDYDEAERLYRSGMSSTDVGARLGVTGGAVRKQLRRRGVPIRSIHESNSLKARGNRGLSSHGYVRVNTGNGRREYEHVIVAEKALGRRLGPGEVVHHINCDTADNRPENLLVCTREYHVALHARMRRHPYWASIEERVKP